MRSCFWLWLAYALLCIGNVIQASTYDYSATTECLEEPWKAQYGGGILQNPEFEEGSKGWTVFGQGKLEQRTSKTGSKFIVALNRTQPSDSPSQRVQLEKGKFYTFSAWIQVSEGGEMVSVIFRSVGGEKFHGGTTIAGKGCWNMLKGGIFANVSGPADLTFQTQTTTEIWVDNVALQPFTKKQWTSHQDKSITKVRLNKVKFHVTSRNNTALGGAKISLKQTKSGFPIGCEINLNILNNTNYQNWFASRFTVTAFGNEMKWYATEKVQGKEDYSIPDAMLQFCEKNNISVRGHNILWDDPRYQPNWANNLSPQALREAAVKRTKSVVSRYKGRLIAWDVVNENLHFNFYENKLGDQNASAEVYAMTYQLDQTPKLFMNEYNTIEFSQDGSSIPAKYAKKLKNVLSYYQNQEGKKTNEQKTLPMGLGLQSRFTPGQPNLAYMRAGMDYLASMGFPLWLTEVFLDQGDNQAEYLEEVLREGYSHPAVEGIVIWPTSPFGSECQMCLTDANFKNTQTGDVVDKFIEAYLRSSQQLNVSSDDQGFSEAMLLQGDYEVSVRHPKTKSTTYMKMKVAGNSPNIVHVQLDDAFVPLASV